MSQRPDTISATEACEQADRSCAHQQRCIQVRWVIGAAFFGALFPLVGWLVAGGGHSVDAIAFAHREQPVLYIVDLAPFILGLAGLGIGAFHSRLIRIRHSIEGTVQTRTAELEHALEELSATQADKDRFVASVSHELRTPLTSVVGMAHALIEQPFSATEHRELLELIARESEEVASIVEDLLVAARVESGQLSIGSEALRLDDELCAVVQVCEITVSPLRIEPVTVLGDPIRIHQIVRNLITNADRYGGETINVEVFTDGPDAVLAVVDNGEGVPEDKLDLIFTAFGKAHQDSGRTESVGLGLTVSRNLAQHMGGDVLYKREGGWTSFELRLPITGSEEGSSSTTDHEHGLREPTKKNKERFAYAART